MSITLSANTCVPSTLDTHSIENADILLLYHAVSIGKHAEVAIASPYTGVFLLMVQIRPSLPCYICFHTGKRTLKRNIPVQPVYNKLGHRRVSSIICFYGQTGSDMSGRFAVRTSEVLWPVMMTYLMLWNI